MDQISTPTSYSGSYLHSLSFDAYYVFCEYDMRGPGLCRLPALCLIEDRALRGEQPCPDGPDVRQI